MAEKFIRQVIFILNSLIYSCILLIVSSNTRCIGKILPWKKSASHIYNFPSLKNIIYSADCNAGPGNPCAKSYEGFNKSEMHTEMGMIHTVWNIPSILLRSRERWVLCEEKIKASICYNNLATDGYWYFSCVRRINPDCFRRKIWLG